MQFIYNFTVSNSFSAETIKVKAMTGKLTITRNKVNIHISVLRLPLTENYLKAKSCLTLSFKTYVRGEGTEAIDFETGYLIILIETIRLNFTFDLSGNAVMWLDYNKSLSFHDVAQELCFSFIANTFQSLLAF